MTQAIASYVERDCTIEHEGHKFEAGGAIVTDKWIVAYPGNGGKLNDWHGNAIGTYRIMSTWCTTWTFGRATLHSIECFVDGKRYVGRGQGKGMLLRAKLSTRQTA